MIVFTEIEKFINYRKQLELAAKKIALIPTMGALHQGQLALIRAAKKDNLIIIVTIFVNEKQFNLKEDLANYPKTLAQDQALLKQEAVDAVLIPEQKALYPTSFNCQINLKHDFLNKLCGPARPGHWAGVAIIIFKLFNLTRPNYAYFGDKDFKQLQLIKALV